MKVIKILFKTAMFVFAMLVAAILALPLWIGPVATTGAETFVPKVTKTPFKLAEFGLNQYSGRLHVGGMELWNPERFYTASESKAKNPKDVKSDGIISVVANQAANVAAAAGDAVRAVGDTLASSETNAVKLGALDVKLSPLSVLGDTIHIEEIVVKDLFIYGDLTFANLREIGANASGDGEKDDDDGKKEEKKEEKKDDGDGKKVVIDRVLVTGAKIQWGHAAVPLPDIELKDIGKGKDGEGVDAESAFDTIVEGICDAADKVCKGAGAALKLAIGGVDAAAGAVGAAAGAVGDVAKGVGSAAGDAAKGAAGVAKDVGSAVGDAAKGAAGAIGDAAKGAADAVKGLFK